MFETGTASLAIKHDVHEFSIDAGSVQFVPSVSVVKISPSAVEAGVKSVLDIEVDADCDCRAGLECRVGQARSPAMCSAGSRILRCAVVPVGVGVVTFTLMMDGQLLSRNSVHLNVFESVIANVAIRPSAVDSTGGAMVTVASSACASGQGRSGGLFVRFGEQGASGYCPYPAVGDAIESSSSLCAVICTAPPAVADEETVYVWSEASRSWVSSQSRLLRVRPVVVASASPSRVAAGVRTVVALSGRFSANASYLCRLDLESDAAEAVLEADDVARCAVLARSTGLVRLRLEAAGLAQGSGVSSLNWVELQVVDAAVVERVVPSVVPAETASVVTLYGRRGSFPTTFLHTLQR